MPDMLTDVQIGPRGDLARTPSVLWLWGVPILLALTASILHGANVLGLTEAGILWTLATAWFGVGCVINARHCGRVHCRIDGVLFPLLSVIGLLNVLGILSLNWNLYWAIFLGILAASFVPEILWKKYA